MGARIGKFERKTRETTVSVEIDLDGTGQCLLLNTRISAGSGATLNLSVTVNWQELTSYP